MAIPQPDLTMNRHFSKDWQQGICWECFPKGHFDAGLESRVLRFVMVPALQQEVCQSAGPSTMQLQVQTPAYT